MLKMLTEVISGLLFLVIFGILISGLLVIFYAFPAHLGRERLMDEIIESNKQYYEQIQIIKDLYTFETDHEAINFILAYEDSFEKDFIKYCEGF